MGERDPKDRAQWYRDIAADYRRVAESTTYEPRRLANLAEAAKYDAIAAHVAASQERAR